MLLAAGVGMGVSFAEAEQVATPPSALIKPGFAVEAALARAKFSGSFAVLAGQDEFASENREMQPTWRFASVTKQVVAVAVMQQVEAGTLALDAPVARYVPTLGIANADRITVRQLLQHTSGLPNPEDGPQVDGALVQYSRTAPTPAPGIAPICRAPAQGRTRCGVQLQQLRLRGAGRGARSRRAPAARPPAPDPHFHPRGA